MSLSYLDRGTSQAARWCDAHDVAPIYALESSALATAPMTYSGSSPRTGRSSQASDMRRIVLQRTLFSRLCRDERGACGASRLMQDPSFGRDGWRGPAERGSGRYSATSNWQRAVQLHLEVAMVEAEAVELALGPCAQRVPLS